MPKMFFLVIPGGGMRICFFIYYLSPERFYKKGCERGRCQYRSDCSFHDVAFYGENNDRALAGIQNYEKN
ncbi:TPA: hypothetical protein ACNVWO_004630 [Escherichia coli]